MKVEIVPGVGTYYIMVDGREVERHGELQHAERRVAELVRLSGATPALTPNGGDVANRAREIVKGNVDAVVSTIKATTDDKLLEAIYNAEGEGAQRTTVLQALYARASEIHRLEHPFNEEGGEKEEES